MLFKKIAGVAAASLLMASSPAVAQSAQSLSLADSPAVRAAANAEGESQLDGGEGYTIYIIGAIVLGLVIWGAIELLGDDEGPESP
jgi:hypothetical protein